MCGIFGYIGTKKRGVFPVDICLKGLQHLEYRGYDSAGIAGIAGHKLKACKRVGKLNALEEAVISQKFRLDVAIAHTRWATHGAVNELNAHPHCDSEETLAIVHNGIVENHASLRRMLLDLGVTFHSETDSEVIAQLIAYYYKGDLFAAVKEASSHLKGAFAIGVVHKDHPDQIIATTRDCPLVIGYSRKNKQAFLSSDPHALSSPDLDIFFLQNDEIALLKKSSIEIFDHEGGRIEKQPQRLDIEMTHASKEGYEHYMLKEIYEQPYSIEQTMRGRMDEEFGTAIFPDLNLSRHELQSIKRILILGCGTSWHAGCIAKSLLEKIARIPTEVEIASEFRYTNPIISEDTLVIAISQSGETADTIAAIREAKAKGSKIIGLCNVPHSTLTRETDCSLFLRAGPEISVCSTKAFTSQLTLLLLLTLYMARLRHLSKEEGQQFLKELKQIPSLVSDVLERAHEIEALAHKYASYEHFFFLGRRYMHPTSMEAALKLKEISYINASGYPAGEMKHGPIALINPSLAVIAMCGNKQTAEKLHSNLMEVKARGSPILAFSPHDFPEIRSAATDIFYLPSTLDELASIPYSVASQLFAYYVAKIRGTEIDRPRNLAKSVTVE